MRHATLAALGIFSAALLWNAAATWPVHGADDKKPAQKEEKKDDKKKLPASKWRDAADPLHVAAFEGDLGVLKKLLTKKDVDVNVRLDFRTFPMYTPLHMAAYEGHVKAVDMLIAKKADLNLIEKANKRTALHLAAANGHVAVVRSLIKAGADLSLKDKVGNTALKLASEKAVIAELTKAEEAKAKEKEAAKAKE
jgi:ankyrin repeat protein